MCCPDLEGRFFLLFVFDFSVDCCYQHFFIAFLAVVAFFEYVISSLEFSDVFEAAFFAFDRGDYWGNDDFQF